MLEIMCVIVKKMRTKISEWSIEMHIRSRNYNLNITYQTNIVSGFINPMKTKLKDIIILGFGTIKKLSNNELGYNEHICPPDLFVRFLSFWKQKVMLWRAK